MPPRLGHAAAPDAAVRIDRDRVAALAAREVEHYRATHSRSDALFERSRGSLLNGVPMNWMEKWPAPFPPVFERAQGARVVDVDANEYVDFCLGDTGAMAGHAPPGLAEALGRRIAEGTTVILPTEDAAWVGEELTRRFDLPVWQVAMTATDANRCALRIARHTTGRAKVLVFNWCYHGTLDETMVVLEGARVRRRRGVVGPTGDPAATTRIVEFNDVAALERELAHGDVACVLAEPALTNIGIVLPENGFHARLRAATREAGTLLAIDETHTLCVGPGGATAAWGLEPDLLVVGKAIGGGVPVAAFGMTDDVADRASPAVREPGLQLSGLGGTLSGNALALAAMRATLSSRLRDDDYARTVTLAARWAEGIRGHIGRHGLNWSVTQLGCRAEYWCGPAARNGGEAASTTEEDVEGLLHLFALNRGVLLTPFHNMVLMSPATSEGDVDRHVGVFGEALDTLVEAG